MTVYFVKVNQETRYAVLTDQGPLFCKTDQLDYYLKYLMKKPMLLAGWLILQLVCYAHSSTCESGWTSYQNTCYKIVRKRLQWQDAENRCNKEHAGHLAVIYKDQHQAFIKCITSNITGPFWIGLKGKQNGTLEWSTGLKFTFDNRYIKNSTYNHSDQCFIITKTERGSWRTINCSHHHYFLCQYSTSASKGSKSTSLWQNIIGKIVSSLQTMRALLLMDKSRSTQSACSEYTNSLPVGESETKEKPKATLKSQENVHRGDQRRIKGSRSSGKTENHYTFTSSSTEQMPIWHYNLRTEQPREYLGKVFSVSFSAQSSSQSSRIPTTMTPAKASTTQVPKTITQATADGGTLMSEYGSATEGAASSTGSSKSSSKDRTARVTESSTIIGVPNENSNDSRPPMMLITSKKSAENIMLSLPTTYSQLVSSKLYMFNLKTSSTPSSSPTKLSPGIQKDTKGHHYNLTPIVSKTRSEKVQLKTTGTSTERFQETTTANRKLISTGMSSTKLRTSVSDEGRALIFRKVDQSTVVSKSTQPVSSPGVSSTIANNLKTQSTTTSHLTKSPVIEKRKQGNHYNLTPVILQAAREKVQYRLSTIITDKFKTTPIQNAIQKRKKGHHYYLTPIISHSRPNSTLSNYSKQSPILAIFNHVFTHLNNSSHNLDGHFAKMLHSVIHNRTNPDAVIAMLKKKLSEKTFKEHIKDLIKQTLGRHFNQSIHMYKWNSTGNGLPQVDSQSTILKPRLPNFGDFFKIVDYFVNICHDGDWKQNELEGIVKEIAENTEPFLKSSLSKRTLERYTKTLDYVDIEVMHVGVSNVSNVNCHGKNGKWKVGKLKLLSKTEINETISISMILLQTPAISILNTTNKNGDGSTFLVSPLLSIVAFGGQQQLQVSHTFSLEINRNVTNNTNIIHNEKEEYNFSCVFLEIETGLWSEFGCEVIEEEMSQISCSCNHTTNFAILMQVRDFQMSKEAELTLSTISYIGCSISLITQFITIAVFTFIEILRCERTFVHRNLCLAIVGAQITFLAGIKAVKHKIVCSIVALLLHYCYMSVFAWMLVEGLHLYSRVVRVFGSELYRKIYYSIFGWGMPVLLVVISAAADWDGYGTDTVCWLSISQDTIWAFVGPALAIITVNVVILVCVTRIVMMSAKHGKQGHFDHVRAGVKGALFLIPILGMTWLFGLLSVNRNLIVFQYLFAVSNSLQGFFIFLFHVVLNSEVRQALMRLRERRSLQKGDLSSTTSNSSNTSWGTKSVSEKKHRRWSRRVTPLQTGTSGIMTA